MLLRRSFSSNANTQRTNAHPGLGLFVFGSRCMDHTFYLFPRQSSGSISSFAFNSSWILAIAVNRASPYLPCVQRLSCSCDTNNYSANVSSKTNSAVSLTLLGPTPVSCSCISLALWDTFVDFHLAHTKLRWHFAVP